MSQDGPDSPPPKSLTRWIGGLLGKSEEEKLLLQRRAKRRRFRNHFIIYIGSIATLWVVAATAGTNIEAAPVLVTMLLWGIFLLMHTFNYREWMKENQEAFRAAEESLRRRGKLSTLALLKPEPIRKPLPAGKDPLMVRCEEAAALTRQRLEGVGAGEVEALAVVDEGLNRVRELLANREELDRVLSEVGGEDFDTERIRIEKKLASSQDPDTKALYRSQLELMENRVAKVQSLQGLHERIEAYAESYLAALSNLRMDAARLKTLDLPHSAELAELMKPVRQIEQQVEGMRNAMQEVARSVKAMG